MKSRSWIHTKKTHVHKIQHTWRAVYESIQKLNIYNKDNTHEELSMDPSQNGTCTTKTAHMKSCVWIHTKSTIAHMRIVVWFQAKSPCTTETPHMKNFSWIHTKIAHVQQRHHTWRGLYGSKQTLLRTCAIIVRIHNMLFMCAVFVVHVLFSYGSIWSSSCVLSLLYMCYFFTDPYKALHVCCLCCTCATFVRIHTKLFMCAVFVVHMQFVYASKESSSFVLPLLCM